MIGSIRRILRRLQRSTSGNAVLLMALGMPALIGGSGLAVDTAQWYMWKRELQFAVDQAALAGAWAKTKSATAANYQTRATQEYNANLSQITDFASTPTVSVANYASGTGNSVTVNASATRRLPFSSFLTNSSTTVSARAQASFAQASSYTACLLAVDPTAVGAITIGGNAYLVAACGIASLSTSAQSVVINGNPTVGAGFVVAAGGIDSWLTTHTNDEIHAYVSGLYDPFATLSPPTNTTARTYGCSTAVSASTTTLATITTTTAIAYTYVKGSTASTGSPTTYSPVKTNSSSSTSANNQTVPNGSTNGQSSSTSSAASTNVSGSGSNKIWEVKTTTVTTAYSNVIATTTPAQPAQASLLPGTYSNLKISCTTVFSSGVYVINGGGLQIDGQYQVTGAGVMFVLKNGAYIDFNGGSSVTLTAMTVTELQSAGVSAAQADLLEGMLVFEDRNSSGTNKDKINGNASTILNGTIYLPKSNITIDGTAGVTSRCLMIAANTITIQGTANFSTFCPAGLHEDDSIGGGVATVKLVA